MSSELKRILYLEDVGPIAEVGTMALEEFGGFEVRHCFSGPEAISALEEFEPQLCLFDVMLPGMDGPQTLEYIRKSAKGRDLPVVFMTAKAQIHEQEAYMKLGALGVIVKPFDPMALGDTVRGYWDTWVQDQADGEKVA